MNEVTLYVLHCDFEKFDGAGQYVVREDPEGADILPPWFSSSWSFAKIDFWKRLTEEQKQKYTNCNFILA